jgi:hypothetical protein
MFRSEPVVGISTFGRSIFAGTLFHVERTSSVSRPLVGPLCRNVVSRGTNFAELIINRTYRVSRETDFCLQSARKASTLCATRSIVGGSTSAILKIDVPRETAFIQTGYTLTGRAYLICKNTPSPFAFLFHVKQRFSWRARTGKLGNCRRLDNCKSSRSIRG